MSEVETDMSRQDFSIAYNGEGREEDHAISVDSLAPALLAFGQLIREANTQINGKKATTKVMVVSDFEHKCFNINFEVLISLYEQAKILIGQENVKNAKEILEWLGILYGPPAVGMSYLKYLRWKKGRKIESITSLRDESSEGLVNVKVTGNANTVVVNQNIINLGENPRALKATRDAFSPVGQEGFDRMEFRKNNEIFEVIPLAGADDIIASCNSGIEEAQNSDDPDVEVTSAWLVVHSPVFESDAEKWRFKLGTEIIYADITETNIAADAINRGAAYVEDSYQVRLEITTPTGKGEKKKGVKYKILEVLRFVQGTPATQLDFHAKITPK